MDPLYGNSLTDDAAPAPYDPVPHRSFLESLTAYKPGAFGEVFAASDRQQQLVGSVNSRSIADADLFDRLAKRVKDATGVALDNPNYLPFDSDPDTRRRARRALEGDGFSDDMAQQRRTAFLDQVRELQRANPDKLGDLDLTGTAREQGARLAFQAEGDMKQQASRDDIGTIPYYAASFMGGMWGARKDPLFWASLPFGGAGVGKTAAARIFTSAVNNATANATFSLLAQPAVQAWRAEAGLDHGFGEAAKDVGFAFLAGGTLGLGVRGIAELRPVIGRIRDGKGTAADYIAAEKSGVFFDDETKQALAAAGKAGDGPAATAVIPEGVNPEQAHLTLAEATARAEDPHAPLPIADPPIGKGVTDQAAREVLEGATSPQQAVDLLRADAGLIESALASDLPQLRTVGRLASLSDNALDFVRRGEVDPEHAALIAGVTPDPARQAELAQALKDFAPTDIAAARGIVTDHLAAQNAVMREAARMGQKPPTDPAAPSVLPAMELIASWQKGSPWRDLDAMLAAAPANQKALATAATEIGERYGLKWIDPGVKTDVGRMRAKQRDRSPGVIKDVIRGAFDVPSPQHADAAIADLAQRFEVADEGWFRTDAGYFDRKVYVRFPDGSIGEVQFWPPGLAEARHAGHALYKQARELSPDDPARDGLFQQMREIYAASFDRMPDGWAAAFGSGGNGPNVALNVASSTTRPSVQNSTGSMERQAFSSNSQPDLSTRTAGIPSKTMNAVSDMDASEGKIGLDTAEVKPAAPSGNIRDLVPIERADGSTALIQRSDAAKEGTREQFFADVVKACGV